mgnify:CR=1 FL=1
MHDVSISGTGVFTPEQKISNAELVEAFNAYADRRNALNADAIAAGECAPVPHSNEAFIVKASGIESRYVLDKTGTLDPDIMHPVLPERADDDLSVMAEMALKAAKIALEKAGRSALDIDAVICAASNHERPYPAIAIEIQKALGTSGAGFDMGLGCSSALAGLHVATNLVRSGAHRRVLVVTPELITAHLNFRDRQTHFIFGDASVAVLIEALGASEERPGRFEIVDTRSWTQFSNNIRTNFGFMSRLAQDDPSYLAMEGNLIKQNGNKVFKDVTIAGHKFIVDFLAEHGHTPETMRRFWLHQANARMNAMILKLAFGG